jgi:CheY-like chemotaxis protein
MKRRILWIEDDYFAIRGLVNPLKKAGFQIDVATSAYEGYQKVKGRQKYDLIVVDLIMPLSNSEDTLPLLAEVRSWGDEDYPGIGLLKWLKLKLKVECPVLILSVIQNPISRYGLEDLGVSGTLLKRGLLPTRVKEVVFEILESNS